jgi:hypothetical protein
MSTAPGGDVSGLHSHYLPAPLQDALDPGDATVEYNTNIPTSSETGSERRWAMLLFSVTTVLLFADQNLMAPNLTAIAEVSYLHKCILQTWYNVLYLYIHPSGLLCHK